MKIIPFIALLSLSGCAAGILISAPAIDGIIASIQGRQSTVNHIVTDLCDKVDGTMVPNGDCIQTDSVEGK